jgi:tetratricopeptide (TPR) repeat protein
MVLSVLGKEYGPRVVPNTLAHNQYLLRLNPRDAKAHIEVGKALLALGEKRFSPKHLDTAVGIQDDHDDPHYDLGMMWFTENKLSEAKTEFERAGRLNPENHKAR